jgi:tripeptidyl-peptidase I
VILRLPTTNQLIHSSIYIYVSKTYQICITSIYRLAAGKTSLGFLNPMLYAYPSALTDTQMGTQKGCKIDGESVSGFTAVTGWDAVTGLGSPNYERLLTVVMNLQ